MFSGKRLPRVGWVQQTPVKDQQGPRATVLSWPSTNLGFSVCAFCTDIIQYTCEVTLLEMLSTPCAIEYGLVVNGMIVVVVGRVGNKDK